MLSLATANDLKKMQPSIDRNLDIINQQVGKFLDDIAKEKASLMVLFRYLYTNNDSYLDIYELLLHILQKFLCYGLDPRVWYPEYKNHSKNFRNASMTLS